MDQNDKEETKAREVREESASGNEKPVIPISSPKVEGLPPSVRFPKENAFSAFGLRGAPFQRLRLAVLIDGDNQPPAAVENFLKKRLFPITGRHSPPVR